MCGICGIIDCSKKEVQKDLYESLFHLQHRGQDSCGIHTSNSKKLFTVKGQGLIRYVFTETNLKKLQGFIGLGHVRYPTTGIITENEIQPFYLNRPHGISLVHNGNIYNSMEIREYLEDKNIHINSTSDSELLLNLISYELECESSNPTNLTKNIETVVKKVSQMCKGAYSIILMIQDYGLVAFRDPYGIRPLVYGTKDNKVLVASESICHQSLEYNEVTNVKNGEIIIIEKNNSTIKKIRYDDSKHYTPCIFEYIFISRAESVIDDVSVYLARVKMGKYLAHNIKKQMGDLLEEVDCVVPIPDTSRPSAIVVSKVLNIPYYEIIIKNRYVSRTFIMDSQKSRRLGVKRKLGIVDSLAKGKNILLIDDSIVRGNTIKHVIETLKNYGVGKIYVASCSPPVRYSNVYGIDIPTRNELIANRLSVKEIKEFLGIDGLIYQTPLDLMKSIQEVNPKLKNFDMSVFDGNYVN
jgi:amidophosphoribosyltransferase